MHHEISEAGGISSLILLNQPAMAPWTALDSICKIMKEAVRTCSLWQFARPSPNTTTLLGVDEHGILVASS